MSLVSPKDQSKIPLALRWTGVGIRTLGGFLVLASSTNLLLSRWNGQLFQLDGGSSDALPLIRGLAVFELLVGIGLFVGGKELQAKRKWAWSICCAALSCVFALFFIGALQGFTPWPAAGVLIVWSGLPLLYLVLPATKAFFGQVHNR